MVDIANKKADISGVKNASCAEICKDRNELLNDLLGADASENAVTSEDVKKFVDDVGFEAAVGLLGGTVIKGTGKCLKIVKPCFKGAAARKSLEGYNNFLKNQLKGRQRDVFKKLVEDAKVGEQYNPNEILKEIFEQVKDTVKP